MAPRNSKRTVRYANGIAINDANTTEANATNKLFKKDSVSRVWPKKFAKWPKVKAPVSVTKAV